MRLADYIRNNLQRLVAEWVEFAYTRLPAADFVGERALTNGSKELLLEIVADMATDQSAEYQRAKSRGEQDHLPSAAGLLGTAQEHARQRLKDGFTLGQLVSEYRALRATVIRCWCEDHGAPTGEGVQDLIRFNEAMDQSLTEAISWFNRGLEEARDIFVGMLGHDLRDPLNAASTAIQLQQHLGNDNRQGQRAAEVATRSLNRISGMIDDLVDFARTRLTGSLELSCEPADLGRICDETREEFAVARPDRDLVVRRSGDLAGRWDVGRIRQLVSNLVKNALQYGDDDSPVTITAEGEGDTVTLSVHNHGRPIPHDKKHMVFDPLVRGAAERTRSGGSMGLGLYIVRMVTEAHGGSVSLESDEADGTTFTVTLPRRA